MQQTENLNLNIIESTDTFSVAPLNENAEKLEAAVRAAQDAADVSYKPGQLPYVVGRYRGTGVYSNVTFELGFRPSAVLIWRSHYSSNLEETYGTAALFVTGDTSSAIHFQEDGFIIPALNSVTSSYYPAINKYNIWYNYIAFC